MSKKKKSAVPYFVKRRAAGGDAESDPVAPSTSRFLNALSQTWPARMAGDAASAFMAPGNALKSTPENPVTTEQMIKPAADLAGVVMGGTYAGVPKGAIGSGPVRPRTLPSSSSLAMPPAPTAADMIKSGRVESVPLAQVRGTQPKMDWKSFDAGKHPQPLLKEFADKPVVVRREDGEYLIFDGHHRAAQAIGDGQSKMDMHVINAKDYAPEFAGRKPQQITRAEVDALMRALKE